VATTIEATARRTAFAEGADGPVIAVGF
jgi:hypothetical protein